MDVYASIFLFHPVSEVDFHSGSDAFRGREANTMLVTKAFPQDTWRS